MASTVDDLINRTFRQWLNRADDRSLDIRVNGTVNAAATTIAVYLTDLMNEEVALISPGTILEHGLELMRVVSVDETTQQITVVRGQEGTTAAEVTDQNMLRVSPPFARIDVYEAVGDSIRELWPDLYSETAELVDLAEGLVELETSGIAGILEVVNLDSGDPVAVNVVRGSETSDTGWAIQIRDYNNNWNLPVDAEVRVKVRPVRPSAVTDTLTSLNVNRDWVEIIVVSAASKMVSGREIDRTTIEFLTEALEAQGLRIGDQFDLATSLLSLREALIEKHQRALTVDEVMRVEYTQVI